VTAASSSHQSLRAFTPGSHGFPLEIRDPVPFFRIHVRFSAPSSFDRWEASDSQFASHGDA
jgi:hypothetical protein